MNILKYPSKNSWTELIERPVMNSENMDRVVEDILENVKHHGDKAICEYAMKFDGLKISENQICIEINNIVHLEERIPEHLKQAIHKAAENIEKFHRGQALVSKKIETTEGVVCWQKAVAIEKVGLYIPGGTAPLFSTVLMLGIPAKLAGCKEVVLCSPPNKEGEINPYILYAAKVVGIDKIYKVGGAQAIAAMAYGTATVPKVYKIFGPGNQFVTKAKQILSLQTVAIDMPAGPSEVLVMADETANADYIAADLLSQCEHGRDSQAILLTTNSQLLDDVKSAVEHQVKTLNRVELASSSLRNSRLILMESDKDMVDFSNLYAPEHLIIQTRNYTSIAELVVNAGSVFLGHYSPESAGDYASGTNHTLPTNGYARNYSGVNLDAFVKKITYQEISQQGLSNLGSTIEIMAEHEQLDAHRYAVTVRLNK